MAVSEHNNKVIDLSEDKLDLYKRIENPPPTCHKTGRERMIYLVVMLNIWLFIWRKINIQKPKCT